MKKKTTITLIFISLTLLSFGQNNGNKISLEDIFKSGVFRTNYLSGFNSMNNGEQYARVVNDSLNTYSYKNGALKETLLTAYDLVIDDSSSINLSNYIFSLNEQKILFAANTERIYRHSNKSNYFIYETGTSKLSLLSSKGKQQLATFSPDANFASFVRNNNLFVVDLLNKVEIQITEDGKFNEIINGAPDWVYEEEFSFAKGFQWSPDSRKIAYYKFNESAVKEFQMTMWGNLYPDQYKYKYPKAGEDNSIVSIHIYNLETNQTVSVKLGESNDIYIPRIKWTQDPESLAIIKLNRLQNELNILLADAGTGDTEVIYQESNKYYIDITDDLTFLKGGEHFIITSEQSGYNHIYLFDMLGNLEQPITGGDWDVNEFYGIDEKKGLVYFSSSESSPLNRELYSIAIDGTGKKRLSELDGTNSVQFSKNFSYYVNTYSNANTPPISSVYNSKGKFQRIIVQNLKLTETVRDYNFGKKEFFKFKTTEGIELNGWMIKPPDFDSSNVYPMLMYVYGGPGSQTVRNSWGRGDSWYQYLAQNGVIIVSVDNRGTGSRGEEFKKLTYLQLGKYETIDQIEAAKYLGSLPYVDKDRIGIWGWSYGGYMTTSCLTRGADYFCMGMAVAPVTNWRYYDNIYTERFMRTPQENPQGYDENSPINHVDQLKGQLLIVHGTADDNVHYQNSIDLVTALVATNKQFEMQFYPNSNHGIYTGKNTTFHLYSLLTKYVMDHLIKKDQ